MPDEGLAALQVRYEGDLLAFKILSVPVIDRLLTSERFVSSADAVELNVVAPAEQIAPKRH